MECAAKVLQPPYSVEHELSVLGALSVLYAGDCIPTVLGRLDEGQGFLLPLLGASLASDDADQYVPLVFIAMEPLLQLLKQVRKGTVFCQGLLAGRPSWGRQQRVALGIRQLLLVGERYQP